MSYIKDMFAVSHVFGHVFTSRRLTSCENIVKTSRRLTSCANRCENRRLDVLSYIESYIVRCLDVFTRRLDVLSHIESYIETSYIEDKSHIKDMSHI